MFSQMLVILMTAVLTSVVTLGAAWLTYQRYLKQLLIAAIDEKADELGERLKERVREGVRQGIREGVDDLRNELPRKATEKVTRAGIGMVEDSINLWLGLPRRNKS